ncbi:UNVERIFIED_CONTAM: hypothetical protein Sradi_1320100 [Sesamum radiatum]|uniref:Uncharacterized protein n=1 Tax=Sesamum radiatum TaxID=300843 RepID=A0AAW2UUR6_SESRA
MEDAQAAKKESRGEKRKEAKEENPNRGSGQEFPLPIESEHSIHSTQALMAVEGKGRLAQPKSWKDGPHRPKSDKFYHFHNNYSHTTEECQHLKNEIEKLIQNEYLQEHVCWEKA